MANAGQTQAQLTERILGPLRRMIDDDRKALKGAAEEAVAQEASKPVEAKAEDGEMLDATAAATTVTIPRASEKEKPSKPTVATINGRFAYGQRDVEFESSIEAAIAGFALEMGVEDGEIDDQPAEEADVLGTVLGEVEGKSAVKDEIEPQSKAVKSERRWAAVPFPRVNDAAPNEGLLSPHANKAVQAAFDQLMKTQLSGGQLSNGMLEEMMRPMLRAWLDANLPTMVERMVREEIERVSRGRR